MLVVMHKQSKILKKISDFDFSDSSAQLDRPNTENKMSKHASLRKSLNFYPTLFRRWRFGNHTLQHICKPARAYTQTKACKRAAILPTRIYCY
jgi:hypothetical protein